MEQLVPPWIHQRLSRLAQLPALRGLENLRLLSDIARLANRPSLSRLFRVVDENLGYALFEAASEAKISLSESEETPMELTQGADLRPISLAREQLGEWTEDLHEQIVAAAEEALRRASIKPSELSAVYLTGGISLYLPLQQRFCSRYGAEKIRMAESFASVACGVAITAFEQRQS